MNFVAHSHVALHCAPEAWDQAFGSILPDLASMAGTRVAGSALSPSVSDGVVLHHRSDSVFHGLEEFRSGAARIRQGLLDGGLATGAARAVGHAGYELLLDGCLLRRPGVREEFAAVLERAPDVADALMPADPARWRELFAALRARSWWLGYSDPAMVAGALHRRLEARRLLAFPAVQLPEVDEVLSAAMPGVEADLDAVLAGVTAAVRGDSRLPPSP